MLFIRKFICELVNCYTLHRHFLYEKLKCQFRSSEKSYYIKISYGTIAVDEHSEVHTRILHRTFVLILTWDFFLACHISESEPCWFIYFWFFWFQMLETALSRLFEGRHIFGESTTDSSINKQSEVYTKFRDQLQALLKKMLQVSLSSSTNKSSSGTSQATLISNSSSDVVKLRELYGMSLKLTNSNQLHAMYELWSS